MADSKESRSERVCANGFCLPESQVVRLRDNYRLSNIFRSTRLSRLYTFVFHLTFFPKAHNPCLFHFRCVLNWFGDWSTGALYQVGKEFTSKIDLEKSNVSVILYKPWSYLQGRLLVESRLLYLFWIRYFFRFAGQKIKTKRTNKQRFIRCIVVYLGSMVLSEQLRTHPSPNPTFTLTCPQLTVVGLGEG